MCVLKADGYGHGAVMLAKRLEKEGCDAFGVAALDEGIELRRAGVSSFILLLNHIHPLRVNEALENGLTMTVFSVEMAERISNLAIKKTGIHIKIDTGMTRVGFSVDEAFECIKHIHTLPNIEIEGIYTHFASAEVADKIFTRIQTERLNKVISDIENAGIFIKTKHACNSAGSMIYSAAYFDMVRLGISLYGCYPDENIDKTVVNLKPAMQLKTQICRINNVGAGVPVSYNGMYVTTRPTRIATLQAGYLDGLSRLMRDKLHVLINGQSVPVIGRICMDQCMADITDVQGEVLVNDEAVFYGEQNGATAPVENLAEYMGTNSYEIFTKVPRRVPRYYTENGKVVGVVNYLI